MQYGFHLNQANGPTRWTFKTVLGVLIWIAVMSVAYKCDAKTTVRVISNNQSVQRSYESNQRVLKYMEKLKTPYGTYDWCEETGLKIPAIKDDCDVVVNYYVEDDVDCSKPASSEDIEGCQAGE